MAVRRLSSRAAVFLDKDGTITTDVPFNADSALLQLMPGVAEGLRRLQRRGYLLVVVSNQSGLALGKFDFATFMCLRSSLLRLLIDQDILIDGFYFCPHHVNAIVDEYRMSCTCRKPMPGLITTAAAELAIDLRSSWMVGDILDDVEAGRRAGCRTVLVDCGNETEWVRSSTRSPNYIAETFYEASLFILDSPDGPRPLEKTP